MKKTFALIFLLAAFALFAIACGDDDDGPTVTPTPTDNPATPTPTGEPETPTETPTEEPTEEPTEAPTEQPSETPGGLWEHGKRTGVPEVDAILEAWENGDIDALKALVLFQQLECVTEQQGLGGPPKCPEGVPGGTTVDVMPASQCEGYYVYEDGLETLFEGFVEGLNGQEYFLYAAWEDDGDEHIPAGWRIQFAPSVDETIFNPQVVLDEDGKIATYRGGCNPLSLQVPGDADFVLSPKAA